jgi:xanthine dehydrogenase YagT iron-sulfur-binding subunit
MLEDERRRGLSRRGFLTSVGAGAIGTAVAPGEAAEAVTSVAPGDQPSTLVLLVNGRGQRLSVEPRQTLLSVLRGPLGLTGTKPGCERGECGACTVLLDGVPRYSCLTLALEAAGHEITTVEGLQDGETLGPVSRAFTEEDAFQCGFCTPGQVVAAEGLLRRRPQPTLAEIRLGMSGNLCRCGAYPHVFRAVRRAAELRRGGR